MMKLVECIPNFSVSRERDEAAFNALVETAQAVAGCTVLDVQPDGTHNRCVFTLVGSPEGIGEAAFRLAKRAMEVIDMTKHQGAHPRMGATDVIPFVPTMDMTVEECVELSRQVAQRIWEELGIPSFLYEESATAPGRVNLAKIRKGQFEGMPEKLLEPEWAPDFGQRKIHPTAGIIAIGARMPLVAFNVNLDTDNVEIAKSIAKAIRGSSGGFKFCKAIGLLLEDRNVAQVSMNMVNYEGTPLYYASEMIRALADRWGVRIIGTELVGLTPAKALIDCADVLPCACPKRSFEGDEVERIGLVAQVQRDVFVVALAVAGRFGGVVALLFGGEILAPAFRCVGAVPAVHLKEERLDRSGELALLDGERGSAVLLAGVESRVVVEAAVVAVELLAGGDDVDDAARAFGVVFHRGFGDDFDLLDLRGGHTADHVLEILEHRRRPSVDQHLEIALSVELHVALGVDGQLRHFAQDLFECRRCGLRIVFDRVGRFLGVGRDERFLDGDRHLVDVHALPQADRTGIGRGSAERDGLRFGIVAHHGDLQAVVARGCYNRVIANCEKEV